MASGRFVPEDFLYGWDRGRIKDNVLQCLGTAQSLIDSGAVIDEGPLAFYFDLRDRYGALVEGQT